MTELRNLSLHVGSFSRAFNSTVYGVFAFILADVFFPLDIEPYLRIVASFGAFAAGLFAQPVGGLIFGYLGDKFGLPFVIKSVFFVTGTSTLGMAFLPSYAQVGFISPLLLVMFRVIQGLSYGACYVATTLCVSDRATVGEKTRKTSEIIVVGLLGSITAMGLGALLNKYGFPSWSWRIVFGVGGVLALFASRTVPKVEGQGNIISVKYIDLYREIKSHPLKFISAMLVAGSGVMPLYVGLYFGNHLMAQSGITKEAIFSNNMSLMALNSLFILFFGRLFSTVSLRKAGLISSSWWFIMCGLGQLIINMDQNYAQNHVPINHLFAGCLFFVLATSPVASFSMPYLSTIFSGKNRFTLIAFAVTLGYAFLGGCAPNISLFFWNHDPLKALFDSNVSLLFFVIVPIAITSGFLISKYVPKPNSIGKF